MNDTSRLPIICGTDFSGNAVQAATAAAELAARAQRRLILVHVADQFDAYAHDRSERNRLLRHLRRELHTEAERLRKLGAEVEETLLRGSLAEAAILDFVKTQPTSLIVISSVSKTAFDRWTLGSVSEHLAENAPAPTLVVRNGETFSAWARGERPLRVVVAVDFSISTGPALAWVKALRELGPCEVIAAHVNLPIESRERLGVSSRGHPLKNPAEVQRLLERDVAEKVGQVFGRGEVRLVVEPTQGRADARLIELAREADADLIVVGTHQRHGFDALFTPSISRAVLRHAPLSVACVPATLQDAAAIRVRECRRVLVAVDFSSLRQFTVPYGYAVIKPGGTVHLLHVVTSSKKSGRAGKSDFARRKAETTERLQELIPAEANAQQVTTEIEVVESNDAALAICQAAERTNSDLVCIGGTTRPGWVAKVVGSVALGVLTRSQRPVLVVWPPAE